MTGPNRINKAPIFTCFWQGDHTRTCAALRSTLGYSADSGLTPDSEEEDTEGRGDGTEGGGGGV